MNNCLVTQIYEQINVAFHFWTKNSHFTENMKCKINMALNHKNEIIDRKDKVQNCRKKLLNRINEIKIKHDYFLIFKENKREYVIAIGVVCLISTLSL